MVAQNIAVLNADFAYRNVVEAGCNSPAALSVFRQLQGKGNVGLFPRNRVSLAHGKGSEDLLNLFADIANFGPDIVLESCSTESYVVAALFSHLTRITNPHTPIVLGGVHCQTDQAVSQMQGMDSVEHALRNDIADIVVEGGPIPMIHADIGEIIQWRQSNHEKDLRLPPGAYWIGGDRTQDPVLGEKQSSIIHLDTVPHFIVRLSKDGKKYGLGFLWKNICRAGCGYCSAQSAEVDVTASESASQVIDCISAVHNKGDARVIQISSGDPNPLRHGIDDYATLFEEIRSKGASQPFKIMLDPQYLTNPVSYARLKDVTLEYKIGGFFIGRDTVSTDIAKKILRRCNTGIRSQSQLDLEYKAIVDFVKFLKENPLDQGRYYVGVSYIITPFDNEQTIGKMLSEFVHLQEIADDNVRVSLIVSILAPFPGTKIRSIFGDMLYSRNDFFHIATDGNCWDMTANPKTGNFMNRVAEISAGIGRKLLRYGDLIHHLQQAHTDCFSNGSELLIRGPYRPSVREIIDQVQGQYL